MNQPSLKTERLLLREFCLEDSKEVRKLAGNVNVAKMTLNIPHPYESGMAEEWIVSHQKCWQERTRITYAVVKLNSNQLLGTVGFVEIEGTQGEIGYWIGEPYWGAGYCTEAVSELIRFSFESLGLERIVAEHLTLNPASGKVMLKAGMSHLETSETIDRYGKKASMEVYEIQNT